MTVLTVQEVTDLKRQAIKRTRGCCEGSPKYPDCRAQADEVHPATGKNTTVAAIQIEPGDASPTNFRVLCNRCLLAFDFPRHKTKDWRDERASTGNAELFPIEPK